MIHPRLYSDLRTTGVRVSSSGWTKRYLERSMSVLSTPFSLVDSFGGTVEDSPFVVVFSMFRGGSRKRGWRKYLIFRLRWPSFCVWTNRSTFQWRPSLSLSFVCFCLDENDVPPCSLLGLESLNLNGMKTPPLLTTLQGRDSDPCVLCPGRVLTPTGSYCLFCGRTGVVTVLTPVRWPGTIRTSWSPLLSPTLTPPFVSCRGPKNVTRSFLGLVESLVLTYCGSPFRVLHSDVPVSPVPRPPLLLVPWGRRPGLLRPSSNGSVSRDPFGPVDSLKKFNYGRTSLCVRGSK